MKDFIKIAVAVLIMAAAVPMRAQEFTKVNDTTYIRQFINTNGVVTDFAEPVDMQALTVKINNDLRSVALCQTGCLAAGGISAVAALVNFNKHNGKNKGLEAASIIFGIGSFGLGVASIVFTYKDRLYIAPDGVVIRISRTEQPKYDNKKTKKGM